jgi:hypothetical protein
MFMVLVGLSLGDARSFGNNRGDSTAKSNGSARNTYRALGGKYELIWEQRMRYHVGIELNYTQPYSTLDGVVSDHLRSRDQTAPHSGGSSGICAQSSQWCNTCYQRRYIPASPYAVMSFETSYKALKGIHTRYCEYVSTDTTSSIHTIVRDVRRPPVADQSGLDSVTRSHI